MNYNKKGDSEMRQDKFFLPSDNMDLATEFYREY